DRASAIAAARTRLIFNGSKASVPRGLNTSGSANASASRTTSRKVHTDAGTCLGAGSIGAAAVLDSANLTVARSRRAAGRRAGRTSDYIPAARDELGMAGVLTHPGRRWLPPEYSAGHAKADRDEHEHSQSQ